jgi:NAD(P)-dependent dehydrogenase (short-subunit alcohol dehydrogenase family)
MDMFRLDGKIAAVTGGSSGIGEAIASLFARQGARVVVLDLNAPAGGAEFLQCDVSSAEEVRGVFAEIRRRCGRLDILVNCAGIAHVGTLAQTTERDFDRVYQVNVKGIYLCSQAAVDLMPAHGGGVILNMASIASLIGIADRFAYSMSKGAVLAMTRSIAVDYMKKIRCNCICPARVHTPFVDAYLAKNYPGREQEMMKKLSEYQPVGRMGTAGEVAALALYLCSEEASFITGQAYPIDGGVLVR